MRGTPHVHAMFTIKHKDGLLTRGSIELSEDELKKLVCKSISAILVESTGNDVSFYMCI